MLQYLALNQDTDDSDEDVNPNVVWQSKSIIVFSLCLWLVCDKMFFLPFRGGLSKYVNKSLWEIEHLILVLTVLEGSKMTHCANTREAV